MSNVIERNFKQFWSICSKVQSLQKKVDHEQITDKKRRALHFRLEHLQNSLEGVKEKSPFPHNQLDDLESQIITLYRIIEQKFNIYTLEHLSY